MNVPAISVIMSCYNSQDTIQKAIDSILHQTFVNFEFIIINDGSADRTGDIILKAALTDTRIRVFSNANNIGLAASLNIGINNSRADLIARMDADDQADLMRLEKQYSFFTYNSEVDILGSGIIEKTKDGRLLGTKRLAECHKDIIKGVFKKTIVFHPTIIIRKRVFDQFGLYDPRLRWAEDADLWFRIYDKVRFHNLQEPLLHYTVKDRLTIRQLKSNLAVKYKNLRKRNMLLLFIPQLIKDFLFMSSKVINYR